MRVPVVTASTSERSYDDMRKFWDKNKRLERPLSPHLTIYRPQLTSILSLAHRATGIAMSATVTALAIAFLGLPHDFTHYANFIQDMNLPPYVINGAKYMAVFPFIYHTANGIRHLAWDWATGFKLNTLYKTGYLCVGTSVLLTVLIVHLC